ncbi:MAG: septum formation initiator family protein [Muribaculaceae bacterium]|nr:septum formation initiator family protein [Muribaculaceae bacterium]
MKHKLTEIYRWCRRYITFPLIVAVGFIVFVLFFNENSYSRSSELDAEIRELEAEIKENNDTMSYYRSLYMSLDTDPSTLERIVREKYHMQRLNEDVYVITD